MGCLGSLIILIIGLSLGGPVGLFIASIIVVLLNSNAKVTTSFSKSNNEENLKEYLENIIMLFSDISLIDGRVSEGEFAFVKDFLIKSFPRRPDIAQYLLERYKFFNENPSSINVQSAVNFLNQRINYNEKLSLFSILVSLSLQSAKSQNVIKRLKEIGRMLFISDYEINSLLGYYTNYSSRTGFSAVADAYTLLGISREATDSEVKKRYKDLVKENHPDKLRHMPESFRKEAEERMKAINEAYSRIKKERSI